MTLLGKFDRDSTAKAKAAAVLRLPEVVPRLPDDQGLETRLPEVVLELKVRIIKIITAK